MTVKSFFLRYGLLVILFLMILGICVLFQTLSIRQKVHVQLFVTGPHTAVAYLSKEALSNTQFRGNSFVTGYSYWERKSLWKIIKEKML